MVRTADGTEWPMGPALLVAQRDSTPTLGQQRRDEEEWSVACILPRAIYTISDASGDFISGPFRGRCQVCMEGLVGIGPLTGITWANVTR